MYVYVYLYNNDKAFKWYTRKKSLLQIQRHKQVEKKKQNNVFHEIHNKKRTKVATLISDKMDFMTKFLSGKNILMVKRSYSSRR